jgi:hypothetical protein
MMAMPTVTNGVPPWAMAATSSTRKLDPKIKKLIARTSRLRLGIAGSASKIPEPPKGRGLSPNTWIGLHEHARCKRRRRAIRVPPRAGTFGYPPVMVK